MTNRFTLRSMQRFPGKAALSYSIHDQVADRVFASGMQWSDFPTADEANICIEFLNSANELGHDMDAAASALMAYRTAFAVATDCGMDCHFLVYMNRVLTTHFEL